MEEDGSLEIQFSGSDIDEDSLTFTVIDAPLNGVFTNGIYSPNPNFTGGDSLTYLANDGIVDSELGTIIIIVININDAPFVFQPMDDIILNEDADDYSLVIDGVFADSDILYGDTLTITSSSLNNNLILTESDSNGVPFMVFVLDANGETDVVVTATDTDGLSANDTIHVTVSPVNDAPGEFFLLTPENEVTIALMNEILNDTIWFDWSSSINVDGDSLIYTYELSDEIGMMIEGTIGNPSFGVEYSFFADAMDSLTILNGSWSVMVTDGQDTVLADNAPFILTIDGSALAIDPMDLIPEVFALHQNYPNPFNPTTTLRYDLPGNSQVNIMIYDIMGREVRRLVNQNQEAGFKAVVWDATNNLGQPVSAGVYLYRISALQQNGGQASEFHKVKKMVLLK